MDIYFDKEDTIPNLEVAMTIALILAGGLGLRMNDEGNQPKQFYTLGEKPIIIHTLEKFSLHPMINAICVVCLHTWEDYLRDLINKFGLKKINWITSGGDSRQASVFQGLCLLENVCSLHDIVVVHDGVRPFVTSSLIKRSITTTETLGNAMTSIRCTDTLLNSPDGKTASYAMERNNTYSVQTPQTYRLGYGLALYRRAYELGKTETINCCELFIELGETIYMINGRKNNIKLTTRDDIDYLKYLNTIMNTSSDDDE